MNILRKGKVLFVADNYLIIAKGYKLYYYDPEMNKLSYYSELKDYNSAYPFCSKFNLLGRFVRAEIFSYYRINDMEYCIAKKGIFRKCKGEHIFKKCCHIPRGSRPLNLCFNNENIYWGEYFANIERKGVSIYQSKDSGDNWECIYTFCDGEINHIHGIFKDTYRDMMWIVTGDRENECIIAYTKDNFASLNIVFRGGQEFRTCNLFFYSDFIIFVTDSQYAINYIKRIDRETLKIDNICPVQSSVIKGGQIGQISFFSTTIEPSEINKDRYSHLWISHDGMDWREICSAKKDSIPFIFQFGTFEFPKYQDSKNIDSLYFSGKALKKVDNKICKIKI